MIIEEIANSLRVIKEEKGETTVILESSDIVLYLKKGNVAVRTTLSQILLLFSSKLEEDSK